MNNKVPRLFDLDENEFLIDSCDSQSIIKKLISEKIINFNEEPDTTKIEQGQTYLGQMIAHDIVPSTNLVTSRKNISPFLNLDSIYGDNNRPAHFDEKGRFILGYAQDDSENKFYGDDLLRGKGDGALIPDRRNDENLIISQLHLFWQKLHNTIIDDLRCNNVASNCYFEVTKSIVIKIFHEITIHDYLLQILHPDIHEIYFKNESSFYFKYKQKKDYYQIPIEFSKAVFRFGHSMVRHDYVLNNGVKPTVKLKDILSNREKLRLDKDQEINWGFFFTTKGILNSHFHDFKEVFQTKSKPLTQKNIGPSFAIANHASKIDSKIAKAIEMVPFIDNHPKDIREINYEANLSDKFVNGGESIRLKLNDIEEFKGIFSDPFYSLEEFQKLPLWPYTLLEAQECISASKGLELVGSIITAEVIKASINYASIEKNSDFNNAYNYIINKIKEQQANLEFKLDDTLPIDVTLNDVMDFIFKNPMKMGYCINYVERGKL